MFQLTFNQIDKLNYLLENMSESAKKIAVSWASSGSCGNNSCTANCENSCMVSCSGNSGCGVMW